MSAALADPAKPHHGLTERQRAFADMWAEAKAKGVEFSQADIAKAAGYQGDNDVLHVAASRCLATPAVREYLVSKARQYLRDGAFDVAVTLRSLSLNATSERVRADTAARLATGLGLIDADQGNRGPAFAIQFVLPPGVGTELAQLHASTLIGQQHQQVIEGEHSLVEGEVGRKAGKRARATPSPPPPDGQAGPGVGVKNRASTPSPALAHKPPAKKSGVKNSRSRKPSGGS